MKKLSLLSCLFLFAFKFYSQETETWYEMMQQPGRNFYEIQAAFNEYWKDKDKTEKGRGYKPFKRWEYFVGPRVYPSGDLSLLGDNWVNYQNFIAKSPANAKTNNMMSSSTWTAMGPMGAMLGSVNGVPAKAGRDNFITFDPTNSSTYWCGSPSGGLWKTTNNGGSWSTTTDYLTVIGVNDLAIDPTNTNIMYLATGDGEGNGDTYSIGVLKSTDGGLTWNTTGLSFTVNQQRQMRRVIVNPVNPQIVIAVGNFGIYRTTNGGTNWTQVQTGNFYDAEFKVGHPTTVFVAGNAVYRSVNSGANFTLIGTSSGIPTGSNRMNVAVTPADSQYVYVLASKSSNSGLLGVYRSTDGGVTFSTQCTTPDILSNPCNASTTGGQGWYDLSLAVSPLNRDEVVVGGVNIWKSTNGGVNYTNIGCWNSILASPPFVHADIHELEYTPSGTLYTTNDGGVYEYTGSSWTDHSSPRNIAQIYKIGLSSLTPGLWITGHQDNGTNIHNSTGYHASFGGDGMSCFIDHTNDNIMFAALYNGGYRRSTNGGVNWSNAASGLTGNAAWVAPWHQDPQNSQYLYAGYSQMWLSTDQGMSWNQLTNTGGSGTIVEFAISPSNNQVMYVIHGISIRKTTDGGTTWSNVSTGIPVGSAAPSNITIDPTDPNTAWVTMSGYSAANKVFQTNNGGLSWTNITYNLPNLPANCVTYQLGTNDRIYVGMDVGVYTKDNSTNVWTLFNNGLPNVPMHDMAISPADPTVLVGATYGRGVYAVNVIQATVPPVSAIGTSTQVICSGNSKQFMDLSANDPTSWSWSVSPTASISNPTSENPSILFPAGGTYTVTFTASNSFGTGSTATQTIYISPTPTVMVNSSTGSSTICTGGEAITLNASGATTYTWLPDMVYTPTLGFTSSLPGLLTYTITGKDSFGCNNTITYDLLITECTGISIGKKESDKFSVFPNPAVNSFTVRAKTETSLDVDIELEDALRRIVLKKPAHFQKDKSEMVLNISNLPDGVYILQVKTATTKLYVTKLVKE